MSATQSKALEETNMYSQNSFFLGSLSQKSINQSDLYFCMTKISKDISIQGFGILAAACYRNLSSRQF